MAVLLVIGAGLARLPAAPTNAWPARLVAPYVDFTAWPLYDIVGAATNSGLRYVTLGFIVADTSQNATTAPATNIPAWGGYTAYSAASGFCLGEITNFRALGGDAIVSFGGAAGTELAGYLTDTNRLKAAYAFVISNYNATRIDFDIEGSAVADAPSINRRSAVMAALQADAAAAGRTLQISLTLPVNPTGLDNNGLGVLQSAISNRVNLTCVNVMAMDYGDSAAPNPSGKMGTYAIMAATNLFTQLKSAYQTAAIARTDVQLWQMVGVCPLIGTNDTTSEVFDQAAAVQLASFAAAQNIGLLTYWALNNDRPGASSSVSKTAFQFAGIFQLFSLPVNFTSLVRSGNNLVLSWKTVGGQTNWVQAAGGLAGWTNLSGPIMVPGGGGVSANWTDAGGLTNRPIRFYRLLVD